MASGQYTLAEQQQMQAQAAQQQQQAETQKAATEQAGEKAATSAEHAHEERKLAITGRQRSESQAADQAHARALSLTTGAQQGLQAQPA